MRSGRCARRRGFAGPFAAEISPEVLAKKDKSPVTVADFGSQALICRALIESFPDDPVIAEEDAAASEIAGKHVSFSTACSGTCV